jgi:hypothetical protein
MHPDYRYLVPALGTIFGVLAIAFVCVAGVAIG